MRIAAIINLPKPVTKKEVQRFIGAMGYYRDYIPKFAQIAKPLTDLTGKHAPGAVTWNDELEEAFECLRQKLCSPPVLSIPNIGKPYCVHTDASGFAVAALVS